MIVSKYTAKWIGIALSDADGTFAFPRITIPNDNTVQAVVEKLIKDEHIECVVVGDTRTLSGEAKHYQCAVLHMKEYLELAPDSADTQAAKDSIIIWKDKLSAFQAAAMPAPPQPNDNGTSRTHRRNSCCAGRGIFHEEKREVFLFPNSQL